jgi:predicted nucleotidyltransferase
MEIVNKLLTDVEVVINILARLIEERDVDPKVRDHRLTEDQLARLAEAFKRHGVLMAYLFGSRARGISRENSDYDVAVLSKNENMGILSEAELAVEVAGALNVPADRVDVVSLNKREFPLTARVLREGIIIYQCDEALRKSWERKAYLELLRNMDLYAIYLKRALKHVKYIKPHWRKV